MITNIQIEFFKSHRHSEVATKLLTVLTGRNGVGKSSVIQTLLLLRQSFEVQSEFEQGLLLNGNLVEIGLAKDARSSFSKQDISFHLEMDSQALRFQFSMGADTSYDDSLSLVAPSQIPEKLRNFSLFNQNFQYIGADRIAPKDSHPRSTRVVAKNRQISLLRGRGEYAAHFLSNFGEDSIPIGLVKHPNAYSNKLLDNVSAWLSEISPGVKAETQENVESNTVSLRFTFEQNAGYTDSYKPQNVGFGISYALPVVLALLATPADGLVLLENPEAHIHPSGQAKLAELIALAAQAGVQVVVETHSDHLINGILVACKKFAEGQKGISPDNVAIYYIDRDENSQEAKVTHVPIVENHHIGDAPAGFFDQFSADLDYLTSPLRKPKTITNG